MSHTQRSLLASLLDSLTARRLLHLTPLWRGLIVLCYQRIGTPPALRTSPGYHSASEEQFAAQVRFLARNFDLIGIDDLEAWERRRGRFAMITIDLGYLDTYKVAFPILRDCGVTAVFFITSGFLDESRVAWWDEIAWMLGTSRRERLPPNRWTGGAVVFPTDGRQGVLNRLLRIYRSLPGRCARDFLEFLGDACGTGRCPPELAGPWLRWSHVREMRRCGMGIGAQTVTHPVLANLSRADQDYEVRHCRSRLMAELGQPVRVFGYPVGERGSFNAASWSCLRDAGYNWAFSLYGGWNRRGACQRYDVRRVPVVEETAAALFGCVRCLPRRRDRPNHSPD